MSVGGAALIRMPGPDLHVAHSVGKNQRVPRSRSPEPAADPALAVRPYEPRDRSAVRHICYVTGMMGDPVDFLWRDAESFADMFSGYYTDREPGSALVLERDGEVVGYLLGCLDSSRAWNPLSVATRHIVRRALLFRPGTGPTIWRVIGAGLLQAAKDRHVLAGPFGDDRWPAHLHIDLLEAGRGGGGGRALVTTWLDRLRAEGVPGCHLETLAENTRAIAFFEAMGFRRHGRPGLVPGWHDRGGRRLHNQVMVQDLEP